jgi:hypothetical protein
MNTPAKALIVLILAQTLPAVGDMVGYGGQHSLSITNDLYVVNHTHDWSSRKLYKLYSDLGHHERFFTEANDFSKVTVTDRTSGRKMFSSPAPAVTYLWLSPDSCYLVCLSQIMLRNPYQLVVWDLRTKTLLWKEHIASRVAVLTAEELKDFYRRFPKAQRHLSQRTKTDGAKAILDYSALGMPNLIGDEAFKYLIAYDRPHPYSTNFSESVTNWVHWYNEEPEVTLTTAEGEIVLGLLDPGKNRIYVHIPAPKS